MAPPQLVEHPVDRERLRVDPGRAGVHRLQQVAVVVPLDGRDAVLLDEQR